MSRALDKDVAALLNASDPTEAFRQVSNALIQPSNGLLEIEILGRSHPVPPGTYFLRDGNALAVPKLALVQAFIAARLFLKGHLEKKAAGTASTPASKDEGAQAETDLELVSAATAVMLLMDPEHLTAANARKRALLHLRRAGDGGRPDYRFESALRRETRLIDSLLTSRLHRHTKSPTLWSHRRWLMQTCVSSGLPLDIHGNLVNVVMVAAERHPRNYYAWCHARWLMDARSSILASAEGDSSSDQDHDFKKILNATKSWALRHHTDTSGWSFLWYLLAKWSPAAPSGAEQPIGQAALLETTKLSASLRWTNESVWVFLRTVVASGLAGSGGEESFHSTCKQLRDTLDAGSPDLRTLQQAEDWAASYKATAAVHIGSRPSPPALPSNAI